MAPLVALSMLCPIVLGVWLVCTGSLKAPGLTCLESFTSDLSSSLGCVDSKAPLALARATNLQWAEMATTEGPPEGATNENFPKEANPPKGSAINKISLERVQLALLERPNAEECRWGIGRYVLFFCYCCCLFCFCFCHIHK